LQIAYTGILSSDGLNISNQGSLPSQTLPRDTEVCTKENSALMHFSELQAKPDSSFGRRPILSKLSHPKSSTSDSILTTHYYLCYN